MKKTQNFLSMTADFFFLVGFCWSKFGLVGQTLDFFGQKIGPEGPGVV